MTKLNEGFWDAVVDKAKRGALAVSAAAGSTKADGKLTARNLATQMYDEYNRYTGSTGLKSTPGTMAEYLANRLGFSQEFAKKGAVEFERFLKSPATYPNQKTDGSSPMGEKPKNFSDGELRKYFLNVAQTSLRSGEAKDAARQEINVPQQNQHQDGDSSSPPNSNGEPDAQTQTQPEPAQEVTVQLQGVNLNSDEQKLLSSIENQSGIEGVAGLVKADHPDVQKLAKKIMLQALRDYRAKIPEKTSKKK